MTPPTIINPYWYVITEPTWYGGRGCFFGGDDASAASNVIDYITINTTGNATDFGDLLAAQNWLSTNGASDGSRLVIAGSDSPRTNVIQYITVGTTGNATDFGDLTITVGLLAGVSNGTRGCFGGGDD